MPLDPKRYEQSIRVCTVFFSALMGFGLKHILDYEAETWAPNERWLCFIFTLLLFLRFLFGSANQLWADYMQRPPSHWLERNVIVWDLVCLTTFGCFGLAICYSTNTEQHLWRHLAFGIAACSGALIDRLVRPLLFERRPRGFWKGWTFINFLHSLCAYFVLKGYKANKMNPADGIHFDPLFLFIVASAILLLADLIGQLAALNSTKDPAEPKKRISGFIDPQLAAWRAKREEQRKQKKLAKAQA